MGETASNRCQLGEVAHDAHAVLVLSNHPKSIESLGIIENQQCVKPPVFGLGDHVTNITLILQCCSTVHQALNTLFLRYLSTQIDPSGTNAW